MAGTLTVTAVTTYNVTYIPGAGTGTQVGPTETAISGFVLGPFPGGWTPPAGDVFAYWVVASGETPSVAGIEYSYTCDDETTYAAGAPYDLTGDTVFAACYTPATPPPPVVVLTVTVIITNIPTNAIYGGSFDPTYSTNGPGSVFASTSSTPSVCTETGNVVSYVGTGTCTLTATVAPADGFPGATGPPQSFLVGPATPTVTITNMPVAPTVGSSFTPTYSTSGNGTVFSSVSSTPGTCTETGNVVTFVGVGSCSLIATVAATIVTTPRRRPRSRRWPPAPPRHPSLRRFLSGPR